MSSQLTAFLTSNSGVYGTIKFEQPGPHQKVPVCVTGDIHALPPGLHALTINANGDISEGPFATGSTFFPLQPITAKNGIAHVDQDTDQISVNDIIGKSLVVYAGSTPNIGDEIAWAVIGSVE